MRDAPTANFTIGPFFPAHFVEPGSNDLIGGHGCRAAGEPILLTGRVLAFGGEPTRNTVVEVWQPDAKGLFAHPADPRRAEADPHFLGWGRAATDSEGRYWFRTVRPGRRTGDGRPARLPHINLMLLASGLMRRLTTTVFLSDDPDRASDPILDALVNLDRRRRLFASRDPLLDRDGLPAYRFDIHLCGPGETPFFED